MAKEQPEVMTVDQAAEYLQLSVSAVRRKLRDGELPGKKTGRVWRIRKVDLERFLTSEVVES